MTPWPPDVAPDHEARRCAARGGPSLVPWLAALVVGCSAASWASEGPAWEPKRTYAFMASVVAWQDSRLAPFTRPRLDDDLVAALIAAGVPRENVVFLKDERATLASVRAGLTATAAKAGPGSTLIFYFQGHGLRSRGKTVLAVYDLDSSKPDDTGLPVDEVSALLQARWRGERLLLFGDSCHSGALADVARAVEQARPGVRTAALTSAMASNRSTGFWTFTEALIAAFSGQAALDRDGDGAITFAEVERFAHDEMRYAERQLIGAVRGSAFEPGFVLRTTSTPARPPVREGAWGVGDYVQARDREGKWYGARVIEVKPGKWKVHFPGWDPRWDDWVDQARLRPPAAPARLEIGRRYEVEWRKGAWYEATVTRGQDDTFWYVHYAGEAGDDDEWVTADRVRPLTGPSRAAPGAATSVARDFQVGDGVAARWKKQWYLAALTARTPERLWRVRYADGTSGLLLDDELVPLAPKVAAGDRVLACWEGKPRMYEGTVLEAGRDGARIKWDDGSAPTTVPLAQLAVVAGR